MVVRLGPDGKVAARRAHQVEIGGNDKYVSLCAESTLGRGNGSLERAEDLVGFS